VERELPSGTVTFLFTDVEGSTRRLQEHGDPYALLLAEHRRLLRDAFARHDGVEVDTRGYGSFAAFTRASDAIAAARNAQRAGCARREARARPDGDPHRRADPHAGGIRRHRRAQGRARRRGGSRRQVLVSEQTARLAGDDDLRDLGAHRLKDLTAPEVDLARAATNGGSSGRFGCERSASTIFASGGGCSARPRS
jgi:class 3 adenylate cyclase